MTYVLHVVGVNVANQYLVELARTPEEWANGLSGKNELPESHGMLFIYNTVEPRSFWMKGMVFPIDIIYIDGNKSIVHIEKNAVPLRPGDDLKLYPSMSPIKYALEVNAGESEDIKNGDSCSLDYNNDISRYVLTIK